MRSLVVLALLLVACSGGEDGTGTSSGGSSGGSGGTSADGGGGDGGSSSSSSGSSSSTSGSGGTTGCKGTLTPLVKNGQTSSCSHPLPAGVVVDRDNVNVYYSPGGGVLQKLCQTSRTSCEQWKGWFFLGEEIAFCDETCSKIDEGPGSVFLVETGCPTTDCF